MSATFSLSLEQDIIGAIMENKIAFDTVSGIINDSDFTTRAMRPFSRCRLPVETQPAARRVVGYAPL